MQELPLGHSCPLPPERGIQAATGTSKHQKASSSLGSSAMQTTASVAEGQGRLGVYEEGMTQFPPSTAAYRYKMSAVEDRLHFWLEDINSKQQWQSKGLGLEDFTTSETTIPQATFADYVSNFQNCLVAKSIDEAVEVERVTNPFKPLGETKECDRELIPHDSGDWELRLTLKFKLFVSVWALTYSFILNQLSLGPIDIRSSKIRDQADRIEALEAHVDLMAGLLDEALYTPKEPLYTLLTATTTSDTGDFQWSKYTDIGPTIYESSSIIHVKRIGIYSTHGVVQGKSDDNNAGVALFVNDSVRALFRSSGKPGNIISTPIFFLINLHPEDEFKMKFMGSLSGTRSCRALINKIY